MDHGRMQGGRPPADARDPDAYADGAQRGSGPYSLPGVPPLHLHDQHSFASLHVERLEHASPRHGRSFTTFEGELRVGHGAHQAVLKAEGEVARGRLHEAHTELLWGYAVAPFWNTQLGLRVDGGDGPNRSWLSFGVEGTAPYNIETRATAYLGSSGRAALRLELAYDAYLTQKLVLQPRTEWQLYAKDDVERGIGKGLTSVSAGLRLRYEVTPQIAPYVGVEWQRGFGRTAELLRAGGERASHTRWVAGLSFWF
ncbi:copper resistance protein B [Ottowia sp. GY511]|nr:copper resistance protein B [Ottowia sp. GY511]